MLNNVWKALMQFLYPPRCPGCRTAVPEHGQWCQACFASIWQPRLLAGSRERGLQGCYCLADYRGPMRHVLQGIKFNKALKYDAACQYLLERFPWRDQLEPVHLVVPVPLSAQRLAQRGYNQAEVIFRPWSEAYWPWGDVLYRSRPTKPQWGLNREERQRNIKRAFQVGDSFRIQGKHILLVDDIYTTGATMKECAQTLHKSGAASVTGLVVASGGL